MPGGLVGQQKARAATSGQCPSNPEWRLKKSQEADGKRAPVGSDEGWGKGRLGQLAAGGP